MYPSIGDPRCRYSIFLVNYNMRGLVERCIGMLHSHMARLGNYEILLADNSNDPQFAITNLPDDLRRNVTLFQLPGLTYVQCLNHLTARSRGAWVLMMHPDVDLHTDCVARLTEFLEAHPNTGAVSPDLIYPTGECNRIRLRMPRVGIELRRLINTITNITIHRAFLASEALWQRREAAVQAETLMSVVMLIRRQMLANTGPIDERLKIYYSNDYLCARGSQSGWVYHYLREALATHYERYTATHLFSGANRMAYKTDPVPANPRMRSDYVSFLYLVMPWAKATALRLLALAQDLIGLTSQFRHYHQRRANIRAMWKSVQVLLGFQL